MSSDNPVRAFLHERGSANHVIEGGLAGLLESWEQVVDAIEQGYSLGLDDYLNDLDARQLLAEALAFAPPAQQQNLAEHLRNLDERMRAQVTPIDVCLWGSEVAAAEGWTAKTNWWYFSRPRHGTPDFLAEISEAVGEAQTLSGKL